MLSSVWLVSISKPPQTLRHTQRHTHTHTHTQRCIVSFGKRSFINNSTWVAINLWWFSMKRQHTLINQWDYRTIFHDLTSISVNRTNSLCRSLTVIAHESEICFQNVNGAICNLTDSGKMPFNYLFTLRCQLKGWRREVRQKRCINEKFLWKIPSARGLSRSKQQRRLELPIDETSTAYDPLCSLIAIQQPI